MFANVREIGKGTFVNRKHSKPISLKMKPFLYILLSTISIKSYGECFKGTIGKIPIIIGGGHNNAYGNITGLALGKGKMVNAIN